MLKRFIVKKNQRGALLRNEQPLSRALDDLAGEAVGAVDATELLGNPRQKLLIEAQDGAGIATRAQKRKRELAAIWDYFFIRIRPSWATEATSVPSWP